VSENRVEHIGCVRTDAISTENL